VKTVKLPAISLTSTSRKKDFKYSSAVQREKRAKKYMASSLMTTFLHHRFSIFADDHTTFLLSLLSSASGSRKNSVSTYLSRKTSSAPCTTLIVTILGNTQRIAFAEANLHAAALNKLWFSHDGQQINGPHKTMGEPIVLHPLQGPATFKGRARLVAKEVGEGWTFT